MGACNSRSRQTKADLEVAAPAAASDAPSIALHETTNPPGRMCFEPTISGLPGATRVVVPNPSSADNLSFFAGRSVRKAKKTISNSSLAKNLLEEKQRWISIVVTTDAALTTTKKAHEYHNLRVTDTSDAIDGMPENDPNIEAMKLHLDSLKGRLRLLDEDLAHAEESHRTAKTCLENRSVQSSVLPLLCGI